MYVQDDNSEEVVDDGGEDENELSLIEDPEDCFDNQEIREALDTLESYRLFLFDVEATGGGKDDTVVELAILDVLTGQSFSK